MHKIDKISWWYFNQGPSMSILRRLTQYLRPDKLADGGFSTTNAATLQPGQIDVRDLIARYDSAMHSQLADAYFEPLMDNMILRRKPFAHFHEAIQIMSSLSHLAEGLRLFPQAQVLDFGAGTCWSSRILATLGCRVTALDVSKNALQIGRSIHQQDPITRDIEIDYRVFDGRTIPVASSTCDRIVSFDAFHHVADQKAILSEFSRVLRDDGIAGFAEPGPHHSLTPSSQMEMKAHSVIENDIRMEDIWSIARDCGFTDVKLSFAMPRQELVSLDEFNRILATRSVPNHVVLSPVNMKIHQNRRVFFLYKSEASLKADSRFAEGLHCKIRLLDIKPVNSGAVRLSLDVENTGRNAWRASGTDLGCANIGVHLRSADGRLIDNDYRRLRLSEVQIEPGEKVQVDQEFVLPDLSDFDVEFDLVSENVLWFEMFGSKPLRLLFRGRKYNGHY